MKLILLLILATCTAAFGQITNINVGTTAGDGTGDGLRTAGIKINASISYLNTQITNGNAAQLATNNSVQAQFASQLDTNNSVQLQIAANSAGVSSNTSQLSFYVTPQQFGATGDGTTDDTVALQNWLNFCSTNINSPIALLTAATNGFYKITDTLYVSNSFPIIGVGGQLHASSSVGFGMSISKSHIRQFTANKTALKIVNPSDSIKLERIFISSAASQNYTNNGCYGIDFSGNGNDSDCSLVTQCQATNFGIGIKMDGIADAVVSACSFGYNGTGVLITNIANSLHLDMNQLSYNYGTGLVARTASFVSVSGDIAWGQATAGGIAAYIGTGANCFFNTVNCENSSTNPAVIVDGGNLSLNNCVFNASGGNFNDTWSLLVTNLASARVVIGSGNIFNNASTNYGGNISIRNYGCSIKNIAGTSVRELTTLGFGNWTNRLSPVAYDFPTWTGSGITHLSTVSSSLAAEPLILKRIGGVDTESFVVPVGLAAYGYGRVWIDLLDFFKEQNTTMTLNTVVISNLITHISTPTVTALAGAGSGATVAKDTRANDVSGQITLTTGTGATSGAGLVQLDFQTSYEIGTIPHVTVTPANDNATTFVWWVTNQAHTGFIIRAAVGSTPPSSSNIVWNYHVMQ